MPKTHIHPSLRSSRPRYMCHYGDCTNRSRMGGKEPNNDVSLLSVQYLLWFSCVCPWLPSGMSMANRVELHLPCLSQTSSIHSIWLLSPFLNSFVRFSMMEDNRGSITVAATQHTPACFQVKVTTPHHLCSTKTEPEAQEQDQNPTWGWDEETANPCANTAISAWRMWPQDRMKPGK